MSDLAEQLQRLDTEASQMPVPVRTASAKADTTRAGLLAYVRAPWSRPASAADLVALREGLLNAFRHDMRAYRLWCLSSLLVSPVILALVLALSHSMIAAIASAAGVMGTCTYLALTRTPFAGNPDLNRRWGELQSAPLTDDLVALAQSDRTLARQLQTWATDGVGLLVGDLQALNERRKSAQAGLERQAQQTRQQALADAAGTGSVADSFQ